jgi:hypothetical protein
VREDLPFPPVFNCEIFRKIQYLNQNTSKINQTKSETAQTISKLYRTGSEWLFLVRIPTPLRVVRLIPDDSGFGLENSG